MTYEPESDPHATDVVELAERHLELTFSVLTDAVTRIVHGEAIEDDVVRRAGQDMVSALQVLLVLKTRMEGHDIRHPAAGTEWAPIDLDSARASIGGLLDRLRDEDGADEVPE